MHYIKLLRLFTLLTGMISFLISANQVSVELKFRPNLDKPNVVIIHLDWLNNQALDRINSPPNITKLISEGIHFINAFSPASKNSDSHLVILTGSQNHMSTMDTKPTQDRHNRKPLNLAILFKRAAYQIGMVATGVDLKIHEQYFDFYSFISPTETSRQSFMSNEKQVLITNKAIQFIKQNHQQPFMLFMSLDYPDWLSFTNSETKNVNKYSARPMIKNSGQQNILVKVDNMLGVLVNHLKTSGLYDNTIFIFTGGNHPAFADKSKPASTKIKSNKSAKVNNLLIKHIRVPLIITYPNGMMHKGTSKAIVSQLDFYRSFAELLDLTLASNEASDSVNVSSAFIDASSAGR